MTQNRMLLKYDKNLENEIKEFLISKGVKTFTLEENSGLSDELYHFTGDAEEQEVEFVLKNQLKKLVVLLDDEMFLHQPFKSDIVIDFQKEFYKGCSYRISSYGNDKNMKITFKSVFIKNSNSSELIELIQFFGFNDPTHLDLFWTSIEFDTDIEITTPKMKKILTIQV